MCDTCDFMHTHKHTQDNIQLRVQHTNNMSTSSVKCVDKKRDDGHAADNGDNTMIMTTYQSRDMFQVQI